MSSVERMSPLQRWMRPALVVGSLMLAVACAPAAPAPAAKPTEVPKPAAAPAKPTAAPAAKPAAEAKPAASPAAAKPAEAKPAASPAAAAKPAASPAAKPAASPAASPGAATKPAAETKPAAATKPTFDQQAVANFYQGKTVKIVVGFSPGGGYDTFSRIIAKHMPKHLPGNPNMIVENRPGAGSLLAANSVYNTEPKDGTVFVTFNENMVLQQALDAPGIEFDARQYEWLGSLEKGQPACVVRTDRGITSMQDVIAGKELVIGTQGPGSYSHSVPRALQEALGANIRVVPGYGGTSQMRLAIEQGEIDGGCWTWTSMRPAVQEWLEGPNPFAKILVVMGKTVPNDPLLKDTPAAETLATTNEARQLLAAVNAPTEMTKPFAVAPGVPPDRVAALRTAFAATMQDPAFLEEVEAAKLQVEFTPAAQVREIAADLLSLPADVKAKVKQIME